MEIITTTQSQKQARRAAEEIAAQGGWKIKGQGEYGAIYQKGAEEISINKRAERQWQVVKEIITVKA